MFKHLDKWGKILVTGPGRSGTRVAARMIAHDLGYIFIDESQIQIDSLILAMQVLWRNTNIVIQCPSLMCSIHAIADDDTMVVVVYRDADDQAASQKRIEWSWQPKIALSKYPLGLVQKYLEWPPEAPCRELPLIKYEYWEKWQKSLVPHWMQLQYEDLKEHPMWVAKEKRKAFTWNQTEAEEWKP